MNAPAIKRPCPFCGERDHLVLSPASVPRPRICAGVIVRDADGHASMEEVDGVVCPICSTMAPLDVWNAEVTSDLFALVRGFEPPEVAS